jgi:hypothetical protein
MFNFHDGLFSTDLFFEFRWCIVFAFVDLFAGLPQSKKLLRIELCWIFSRLAQSNVPIRFRRQRGVLKRDMLKRVQPLFLIDRDGEQDGLHGIVARLIGGGLRVGPHAAKQAVEIFLIFAAQCAAEFRPARDGVVDQLPECGNGAAHVVSVIRDL